MIKGMDSHEGWLDTIYRARSELKGWRNSHRNEIEEAMYRAFRNANTHSSYGEKFTRRGYK